MHAEPGRCVVVEDSPSGVRAGLADALGEDQPTSKFPEPWRNETENDATVSVALVVERAVRNVVCPDWSAILRQRFSE